MTEPTAPNLPAPLDGGSLDPAGLRALAPQLREQLIQSIRGAARELRANRGSVVYPEDTYDLVRRLTEGGEALRQMASSFEAAAAECDALTEEEALTAMGEQDGTLLGSLFVPDGEGHRIAVKATWKAGDTSWDLQSLIGWLIEDEASDETCSCQPYAAGGDGPEEDCRQHGRPTTVGQEMARAVVDRLLDLGNFSPGIKKIEALRIKYAEQQKDDVAGLLRGLRSVGTRTYQGVKITREETKK